MTDPDLVAFIRNYDMIVFIETIKGNDVGNTWQNLVINCIMWVENANLTRIDHTYDYLVWLTLATDYCQKNIKIGCAYIPPEVSSYVGVRNDYFTILEEEVARYIEMHQILLCGDFKSRTGQAPDYESGVIDSNANVPSERSNEDIVSNKYSQLL